MVPLPDSLKRGFITPFLTTFNQLNHPNLLESGFTRVVNSAINTHKQLGQARKSGV